MKVHQFVADLARALYQSFDKVLEQLKSTQSPGQVYALCVYATNGFTSLSFAAQTLAALAPSSGNSLTRTQTELIRQVYAPEWSIVVASGCGLDRVHALIDEFYDVLFDGEFEDHSFDEPSSPAEIQEFAQQQFLQAILLALDQAKLHGRFNDAVFTDDVLTGLQFTDPDVTDVDSIALVSARTNSSTWHNKIEQLCQCLRASS